MEGFQGFSLEAGTITDSHCALPYYGHKSHPPPRDTWRNDASLFLDRKETSFGGNITVSTAIVPIIEKVGGAW